MKYICPEVKVIFFEEGIRTDLTGNSVWTEGEGNGSEVLPGEPTNPGVGDGWEEW